MALTYLTKAEADSLKTSNVALDSRSATPLVMLGYCKETEKFLIQDKDGVKEVSDIVLQIINQNENDKTGAKTTWYEKLDAVSITK